jgi:hypothetical protein
LKRYSHQRITKIKRDRIEDLLKKAEATKVEDACTVQPAGSDLIPYPDMNNLRNYTRDYLLKGLTKTYPVKFNEDGQTYLTTIVDGLPLFTKMSKTVQVEEQPEPAHVDSKLTIHGNPTIGNTGIVTDISLTNYLTRSTSEMTGAYDFYFSFTTPATASTTEEKVFGCTGFCNCNYKNTTLMIFENTTGKSKSLTVALNTKIQIRLSLDGTGNAVYYTKSGSATSWTSQGTITNFATTAGSPLYIGKEEETSTVYWRGTIDLSGCKIVKAGVEYPFFHPEGSVTVKTLETSKPGLWLSNLSTPIYNSNSGGFLANNFIHNNESSFNTVNSDIIGNYAYTFTQRGIIHRVAGSSHYDQDSYNQMWSPSALSCISHEAIIIPELLLQQTYTTYQSMVVPADPDTQSYDETKNKTVEYNFIDNNNNDPATTTAYNGRFVGVDWSYELKFTPNGNGSGNNYGSGSDPYVDNGSNGGCIAGTIEYNLLVNGEYVTCTQTVNECMQTGQSYFNSNSPQSGSVLNDSNYKTTTYQVQKSACCSTYLELYKNDYVVQGSYKLNGSLRSYKDGCTVTITPGTYTLYTDTVRCGVGYSGRALMCSSGSYMSMTDECTYGYCGNVTARGSVTLAKADQQETETGINIYLNMTDLKAQYEANGLPWTGDCNTSRFQFEFSTTKCTSPWCTSLVIAENVDINNLGDISKLNDVIFSK